MKYRVQFLFTAHRFIIELVYWYSTNRGSICLKPFHDDIQASARWLVRRRSDGWGRIFWLTVTYVQSGVALTGALFIINSSHYNYHQCYNLQESQNFDSDFSFSFFHGNKITNSPLSVLTSAPRLLRATGPENKPNVIKGRCSYRNFLGFAKIRILGVRFQQLPDEICS